ncbi:hypothetical protein SprV_0401507000 [Sparganum proliferum]
MIAAVESVINQTEAAEETKNLIRHQVSSLLMTHKPREILPKVKSDALRELNANNNIVIVPADKGRSIVVLDRTDYLQKAKNLLEDRQFYVPCETNPAKTLTREINTTQLALEISGAITPTDAWREPKKRPWPDSMVSQRCTMRALLSGPLYRSRALQRTDWQMAVSAPQIFDRRFRHHRLFVNTIPGEA